MSPLRALKSQILVDGQDLLINDVDMARIRECLPKKGPISPEDLKVLTEMRTEAAVVCAAFDDLFFPALKSYLLADGQISQSEQFLLLRMLYGGGGIDEAERRFLQELRQELTEVTPEFEDDLSGRDARVKVAIPPDKVEFRKPSVPLFRTEWIFQLAKFATVLNRVGVTLMIHRVRREPMS